MGGEFAIASFQLRAHWGGQGDAIVTAVFKPPTCIGSSYLLLQEYVKMFQESRPESASAVSSHCSVFKAVADEL